MENIIDLLRETIRRNEDLSRELGAIQRECMNWREKYYDYIGRAKTVEGNMEEKQ